MPTPIDNAASFSLARRSSILRGLALVLLAGVCLSESGCSERTKTRPDYPAQVRGTISLEDRPLPSGTVTFIPDKEENEGGRPGIARIESDGSYRVGNANPDKPAGLPPGKYKVTVMTMAPDPTKTGYPVAELVTPEVYADYTKTPFEVEVIAGDNERNFSLTR